MKKLAFAFLLLPLAAEAQVTGGSEVWLWTESVSASGVDRKELVGGRVQAWANFNQIGTVARIDVTGTPGQFRQDKPETYKSAAIALAAHWNALRVQDAKCGPAAGAEYAALLETKEGETPKTASAATFGIGLRCSYKGTVVYSILGKNQALKGFASTTVAQIPLGEWAAWVVTAGLGEGQNYVVKIDTAVRWGTK